MADTVDPTEQEIVYQIPAMASVAVRRDITFKSGADRDRRPDVYLPREFTDSKPLPVVLFMRFHLTGAR
jgi:hypothetical protein